MNQAVYWTTSSILTGPRELSRLERQAIVDRLERLGWLLDDALALPGTKLRIGWDGIVGLVPGVGDALTTALSAYIVWEAYRLGASRWTLARMLGNVGVDFLAGLIPVIGDLADLGFKANRRNLALLRRALAKDRVS